MHDFRPSKKSKNESDGFLAHSMDTEHQKYLKAKKMNSATVLAPILEDEDAQAIHLRHLYLPQNGHNFTSSRRTVMTDISDPDNGIMFLDGEDRVLNPVNQKTPPPPMWGEILEEDLYDDSTPFYDNDLAVRELI